MIHVMAPPVWEERHVAAVVGYDAIAVLRKNSICVSQSSADSGQPCEKTIGCPVSPVLVVDLRAVFVVIVS